MRLPQILLTAKFLHNYPVTSQKLGDNWQRVSPETEVDVQEREEDRNTLRLYHEGSGPGRGASRGASQPGKPRLELTLRTHWVRIGLAEAGTVRTSVS